MAHRITSLLPPTHAIPDWHLAVHEDKIVRRLRARNGIKAGPAVLSHINRDAQGTTETFRNETINTIVFNDH